MSATYVGRCGVFFGADFFGAEFFDSSSDIEAGFFFDTHPPIKKPDQLVGRPYNTLLNLRLACERRGVLNDLDSLRIVLRQHIPELSVIPLTTDVHNCP